MRVMQRRISPLESGREPRRSRRPNDPARNGTRRGEPGRRPRQTTSEITSGISRQEFLTSILPLPYRRSVAADSSMSKTVMFGYTHSGGMT